LAGGQIFATGGDAVATEGQTRRVTGIAGWTANTSMLGRLFFHRPDEKLSRISRSHGPDLENIGGIVGF
jgi:hypothetical protein